MIGLPYRKYMNSNNDVDMAAAIIMCSVEAARAPRRRRRTAGCSRTSGADCHEHPFVSNRDTFAAHAGDRARRQAGARARRRRTSTTSPIVDLYSCFPSAVQLGAQSLGLSTTDRQLTRTGGLPFAGGPWNNYVMHAIATVVDDLREQPGENGLVWANGGYATKHAFGVYGTEPPAGGFRHAYPQDEIDALPRRELADRRGRRRPGDDRGVHGHARPRGRAGAGDRHRACSPTAAGRGACPPTPT